MMLQNFWRIFPHQVRLSVKYLDEWKEKSLESREKEDKDLEAKRVNEEKTKEDKIKEEKTKEYKITEDKTKEENRGEKGRQNWEKEKKGKIRRKICEKIKQEMKKVAWKKVTGQLKKQSLKVEQFVDPLIFEVFVIILNAHLISDIMNTFGKNIEVWKMPGSVFPHLIKVLYSLNVAKQIT